MWGCVRCIEFFEGDNSRLSMTRLLCFLSFFPASWVLMKEPSSEMLGWYLSAYVLGYVGGKVSDALSGNNTTTRKRKDTDNGSIVIPES